MDGDGNIKKKRKLGPQAVLTPRARYPSTRNLLTDEHPSAHIAAAIKSGMLSVVTCECRNTLNTYAIDAMAASHVGIASDLKRNVST